MSAPVTTDWQNAVDTLQFNRLGKLHHLLTLDGLDRSTLHHILDTAENFTASEGVINKVPLLRGKTVANLFFENSTRTRSAFELAARRLSADVLNIDLVTSSTAKGESLLDTLQVLQAMQCDMFVVRHHQAGAAHFIARHVDRYVNVLNGGDGRHSHPTQGLLDMFTIRRCKGDFSQLKVVIVGDIRHSRVARSGLSALRTLGTGEICLSAPRTLLPEAHDCLHDVTIEPQFERALVDADVIMCLRLQNERMHAAVVPSSGEFFRTHGLNEERLAIARPDAIVMHPGPTNRGVEIAASVADGPQARILDQVTFGVAVRMAVMAITIGSGEALRGVDREIERQTQPGVSR